MNALKSTAFVALVALATPAFAYIGPGSGISLLGGLWAVLVGIVLALAAILFWPIRYMIRRMRAGKNAEQPEPAANEPAAPGGDSDSKQ